MAFLGNWFLMGRRQVSSMSPEYKAAVMYGPSSIKGIKSNDPALIIGPWINMYRCWRGVCRAALSCKSGVCFLKGRIDIRYPRVRHLRLLQTLPTSSTRFESSRPNLAPVDPASAGPYPDPAVSGQLLTLSDPEGKINSGG